MIKRLSPAVPVDIVPDSTAHLAEYARVPSALLVTEVFDAAALQAIAESGRASPTPVATPFWKDYDSYPDSSPPAWLKRFDPQTWRILAAYENGERIAGAVVILDGTQVDLLHGQADCAVLWDVRVTPEMRRRGVGRALVQAACRVAKAADRQSLWVETQNVNVPACRLYMACGFTLVAIRNNAYPGLPGEVQLFWTRDSRAR